MVRFTRALAVAVGLMGVAAGIAYATVPSTPTSSKASSPFMFRKTVGQYGFANPVPFGNGAKVALGCVYTSGTPTAVQIILSASTGKNLQFSGTATTGRNSDARTYNWAGVSSQVISGPVQLSFDGVVYDNKAAAGWVHVDIHGSVGNPCSFWGVVRPVTT